MAAYNKKTIEDIEVAGKTVLVRCDFNVPMKDGVITSDKRIVGALPTIEYLMNQGAKLILCSHMGKPHSIFTEGFGLTKKEKKAVLISHAVLLTLAREVPLHWQLWQQIF